MEIDDMSPEEIFVVFSSLVNRNLSDRQITLNDRPYRGFTYYTLDDCDIDLVSPDNGDYIPIFSFDSGGNFAGMGVVPKSSVTEKR